MSDNVARSPAVRLPDAHLHSLCRPTSAAAQASAVKMTEEIDKHILKKYEVQQKLGKGVSPLAAGAVPWRAGVPNCRSF